MALLKIITGDSAGAIYDIGAGSYRVGRTDANNIRLPDGSISSAHCEVSLDPAGNLVIRDLGSTNGTFVNGQRVREALIQPGQQLRLGNLELVFENPLATASAPIPAAMPVSINLPPPPVPSAARVAVAAPPPAPETLVPLTNGCANHPHIAAVAVCNKCGTMSCDECSKKQKVGRKIMHFCPRCGGKCADLGEVAKQAAVEATRTKTMGTAIKRSLSYPFRGNGVIILVCGTLFFGIVDLLPGFFLIGLALTVLLWGYMFAFMQRIIVTSAAGEDDPPEFPDVSDIYSDICIPFLQLFVTSLLAFLPPIFVFYNLGPIPGQFALILSMVYFPMAILGVAMSDSFAALNPVFVLSSVMRIFKQYVVTCFVFAGLAFMYTFVRGHLDEIELPLLVTYFLFWFVFLVFLMIGMRILGMLYYLNKQKLGWGL
ncbi:MAG TPA: FHA domain-containing protein [Verrucomicrobiae bacterium]|nr:FHA domain-containing protein [Verrucomicrobiae bacterium]